MSAGAPLWRSPRGIAPARLAAARLQAHHAAQWLARAARAHIMAWPDDGHTNLGWDDALGGVYHAAGSGATTWHGLAEAVFARAARHGLAPPTVAAIATADWPTPARRPPDSRLDCGKLHRVFGLRLPAWRDGVDRTVDAVFA